MRVFLHGDPQRNLADRHTMQICPAAHVADGSGPDSWYQVNAGVASPKTFEVVFLKGEAEVPDEIGNYLVAYEMAHRNRRPRSFLQPIKEMLAGRNPFDLEDYG